MKSNAVVVVLILACLGLGVGLVVSNNKHEDEKKHQNDTIVSYSNHVADLEGKLSEQITVNSTLETNLAETKLKDSNDLAAVQGSLSSTQADLQKSQADARAAAAAADAALAEKDKKISGLESQNQELDKESADLKSSITNLDMKIQDTQKQLDASIGDRNLLLTELKRLQAEKADLEKKFNDLAVLKDQVRKLKDELSLSRRLDWIRRGIYDSIAVKGGERLMHPEQAGPPLTNAAMNVEIRQDGGVNVSGPGATNAAPGN